MQYDPSKEVLDLQWVLLHDHPLCRRVIAGQLPTRTVRRGIMPVPCMLQEMLKAQVSHSGTFSEEAFETFRKQIAMYEN
jgi:hypothetical protein